MGRLIALLILTGVLTSCVHSMRVLNRDEYFLEKTSGPRLNVAVLKYDGDTKDRFFHQMAVKGLEHHPSVAEVRTGWQLGTKDLGFTPSVIVDIDPKVEYRGSGLNYLITFPGYILFTHAWHGYIYHGDVVTAFEVYSPINGEAFVRESVSTKYEMRHCDFERGFFPSTGWWLPYAGTPTVLLSGFYMITYDTDATQPFKTEIRRAYGKYIAENIMRPVIAQVQQQRGSHSSPDV